MFYCKACEVPIVHTFIIHMLPLSALDDGADDSCMSNAAMKWLFISSRKYISLFVQPETHVFQHGFHCELFVCKLIGQVSYSYFNLVYLELMHHSEKYKNSIFPKGVKIVQKRNFYKRLYYSQSLTIIGTKFQVTQTFWIVTPSKCHCPVEVVITDTKHM